MNEHGPDSTALAKLVDRSGFLFQLAVEEHVRNTSARHEWQVLAREYPWRSRDKTKGGFTDFVLGRSALRAVAECKRTQGGEWIFLVPETEAPTANLRALWSYVARDRTIGLGWADFRVDPPTYRAEFCIVRGGSDDDRPMLERVAGELVRASEALAREELEMAARSRGQNVYVPVIITNATLYACRVSPTHVDLASGLLPNSATFERVGAIRFRKALSSEIEHEPANYDSLAKGLSLKERSAVVVNVAHLEDWLTSVREQRHSALTFGPYPWEHLENLSGV